MSRFGAALARVLPHFPRAFVWKVARRYVAGESFEDAAQAAEALRAEGAKTTLALVGEDVDDVDQVRQAVAEYREVFSQVESRGLGSSISVKPTHLGLRIGRQLLRKSVDELAREAARQGRFLRLDMEDHTCTEATLEVYEEAHQDPELEGHLGVVLQAALRRTPDDIDALPDHEVNVRLCKGIYLEPREIAYTDRREIQWAFIRALEKLFYHGAFVGIATHDDFLVEKSLGLIERYRIPKDRYEFQMLLGVRPKLRKSLIQAGHAMRVYVPFGPEWHAYSMRRLRENPKVATHITKALFKKG